MSFKDNPALLALKERFTLAATEEAKKKKERLLPKLKKLANRPIEEQINEFGSYAKLANIYAENEIENNRLNQIKAFEIIQKTLVDNRESSESSYSYHLLVGKLPPQKLKQFNDRLERECNGDPWKRCNIWFYSAAEWVIEDWAKKNKLECVDYNIINQYHHQDYKIKGINVDVKTTVGVGRRELAIYYSTHNDRDKSEIIIGVKSRANSRDEESSYHYIHGVFDPCQYKKIRFRLQYFPADKSLINPCYFQSIDVFFGIYKNIPYSKNKYNRDVVEYLLKEDKLLQAVFHIMKENSKNLEWALKICLPSCHHDFIPIIKELAEKKLISLLPHYLANYLIEKLINKKEVDYSAITNILYSLYMPFCDQRLYIDNLLKACNILGDVRCKYHPNETIDQMDIEFYKGAKPTLVARCSYNASFKTTFLTYSWRTGETIVYGSSGVTVCDSDDCGCLTHIHDNEKIGKRSCQKYGRNGTHRYSKHMHY